MHPDSPLSDINPLLDFSEFPRFEDIKNEHIAPALDILLSKARSTLQKATDTNTPATWDTVAQPLDDATEKLGRAWGIVGHLHAVMDSPALRDIYTTHLPRMTEFWTALGQNEHLYGQYKKIASSSEFGALNLARQKIIQNALRDFRLSGAELLESQKPRYAAIQEKQAALSAKFSQNVLDATEQFSHWITEPADLAGLPDDVIEAAKGAADAENADKRFGNYKFTLHFPSYFPVLQYAQDRNFRETLYAANAKRASEFGPAKWDNSSLMKEILQLRQEESAMLGFKDFATLSLMPKMAQSPKDVLEFLYDLGRRARPYAEKDLAELTSFARSHLQIDDLQPWDIVYASEKLREHRYAFSDNAVKQYFPEPKVLEGLFAVTETLFGVKIQKQNTQVWHPDVRFFSVSKNDHTIAHFYLDAYAREGKRGGAWMDDARGRKCDAHGIQTPIAYLTCNFPAPVGGKPATLTHDDVITLFHEFGHGLHHMLTQVEELGVSGINGVEWDAVELPSQFMENFVWEWDVVSNMTRHIQTGQTLPRSLFDKMTAAKNFQSGLQTLRQVEFSVFDMLLHSDYDPSGEQSVLDVLNHVRQALAVIYPPAYQRFPHSFSHIFAGGYAAGYYSYKWAEVLSADAYEQFEETGILNPDTGQRFLDNILAVGGSRPAAESFKAFRGRDPDIKALLRHNGMSDVLHSDIQERRT